MLLYNQIMQSDNTRWFTFFIDIYQGSGWQLTYSNKEDSGAQKIWDFSWKRIFLEKGRVSSPNVI